MRVIVCPHELAMGGSQLNAIDLAAAVRDRGHDVVIYASDGVLSHRIDELGLERIASPDGTQLSLPWARDLVTLARAFEPDLIHTYEWAPSLGAAYGARQFLATPQIMTVLSMDVPDFLPADVPLIVGTRQLADGIDWHSRLEVIEPPVDTEADRTRDMTGARRRQEIPPDVFTVSIVCRMTDELGKAAGVEAAIDSVRALASEIAIRLILVGDGPALPRIRQRADQANAAAGRLVVDVRGRLRDPSDIYEASDAVVGMGSSILRAMSFGKPVVVQGDAGFTRLLVPDSVHDFLWAGFYGKGGAGAADLTPILRSLAASEPGRKVLGAWSRQLVVSRFSLSAAADRLEHLYESTVAAPYYWHQSAAHVSASMARLARFRISRAVRNRVAS